MNTPPRKAAPKKKAKALRIVSNTPTPAFAPPPDLAPDVHAVFVELVTRFREQLNPATDIPQVVELAQVRCQLKSVAETLDRDGVILVSVTGAQKRHPALAALSMLQVREHRLVIRLGLAKPSPGLARQHHVASRREALARHIDRTFAMDGGSLLAGYDEWILEKRPPGSISNVAKQMAGIALDIPEPPEDD